MSRSQFLSVDRLERLDRNSMAAEGCRPSFTIDENFAEAVDRTRSHDSGMNSSHIKSAMNFGDDSLDSPLLLSPSKGRNSVVDIKTIPNYFTSLFYSFFGLTYYDYIFDRSEPIGPQMWKFHNVGLYAHYAALGLNGGIAGLCQNFCFYTFNGSNNVCANASSLIFVPWGFKIFYAIATDTFRPMGSRRKVYMIVGWIGVLFFTFLLAIIADDIDASSWLGLSLITQFFLMIADVPADGYSVELGQLEGDKERGMILSTGQRIRFAFTMGAGLIQALLVNGVTTNNTPCDISFNSCWSFGLTIGQYYWLIACMLSVLVIPIILLREPNGDHIPKHSFRTHCHELWGTLMNPTTMFLLIFVSGNGMMSSMTATTPTYVQYELIGLTNFQSGISSIMQYLAVVAGIMIFQNYFIQKNWRITLYLSVGLSSTMGLMWLLVYYDIGGLLNPWFTIFITLNQSLAQGISQVLFSMAVIELAKPGQEAITYELIISVANSASSMSTIIATQLLTPLSATSCDVGADDDTTTCNSSEVNLYSYDTFKASDGPAKFAKYQLVILAINIVSMLFFTQFLPRQKNECREWKQLGESGKFRFSSETVGKVSTCIAVIIVSYQIISAVCLFNPQTACLPIFGGSGC